MPSLPQEIQQPHDCNNVGIRLLLPVHSSLCYKDLALSSFSNESVIGPPTTSIHSMNSVSSRRPDGEGKKRKGKREHGLCV